MQTDLAPSTPVSTVEKFPWLILFTILLAPLITVIDVFIMNVSLPTIQGYFHASDAAVQGIIASYLVGYSVFLITGSRAGDHFGRKKVFMGGLFVFTVASALCGYAGSIEQLIIFRFLQGIAAGFAVPQTVTLIQLNFKHGEYRSKALGYYGITLGIASVMGQFLGGYFVTAHWMHEPWRLIFLINVPIGVIAVTMATFFIPESKIIKKANFDMGGVLLLTAGLSALIYPIIQGRELGWPAWTFELLAVSFLILFAFVRYQYNRIKKEKSALLPLHLFKIRSFNLGLGMVFFYFALFSAFLLSCALFLQTGHHVDPLTSASYFVILGFAFMFSSHWSIKNASKFGTGLLQIACLLLIISFATQLIWFKDSIPFVAIIVTFVCYGLGAGMLVPSFLKIALKDVPHDQAGVASGIYSTVQQFSSALGVSMIGGVFFYVTHQKGNFDAGYHAALYCLMGYAFAVLALLFVFQKTDHHKGAL
ncbi:MFS transporter [Mucilaginibacter jinjuensis]|uniref:MFS transporter n=1 Tax=Mucilaginibacter jinjuensis TaxID=1176721 RepID=A0ABY7T2W2_9SPHI|nr:MFS transporter [Mucilaginibacter jinjuensis]WCT10742.1 MFS transporter [Mucilaginibacter jinjuensis]